MFFNLHEELCKPTVLKREKSALQNKKTSLFSLFNNHFVLSGSTDPIESGPWTLVYFFIVSPFFRLTLRTSNG
jgi:hypothetical protein